MCNGFMGRVSAEGSFGTLAKKNRSYFVLSGQGVGDQN